MDTAALESKLSDMCMSEGASQQLSNDAPPAMDKGQVEVPNEVLVQIFSGLLLSEQIDSEMPKLRTALRLVSSHWNQVIICEPHFWKDIYVGVPIEGHGLTPNESTVALDSIKQTIARSENYSRRLKLVALGPSPRLVSLIKETPNWVSIELIVGRCFPNVLDTLHPVDKDTPYNPFQGPNDNAPANVWKDLQVLVVKTSRQSLPNDIPNPARWSSIVQRLEATGRYSSDGFLEDWPKISASSRKAPALRSLTLHLPARSIYQWDLPFSQLTHLDVASLGNILLGHLKLLAETRFLESFTVRLDPVPESPGGFPDASSLMSMRAWMPRPMPTLRSLDLTVTTRCDVLHNFIGKMCCPNLERFRYHDTWNTYSGQNVWPRLSYSRDILEAITSFIKRSGCQMTMRSLIVLLEQATMDDGTLAAMLREDLFPALESMILGGIDMQCEFLEMQGISRLLPAKMKQLVLYCYSTAGQLPVAHFARWARKWYGEEGPKGTKLEAKYITMLQRSFSSELADVVVEEHELYEGVDWEGLKGLREHGVDVRALIEYD